MLLCGDYLANAVTFFVKIFSLVVAHIIKQVMQACSCKIQI